MRHFLRFFLLTVMMTMWGSNAFSYEKFCVDGVYYVVNWYKNEYVDVYGCDNDTLVIPEYVQHGSSKYEVWRVEENAFKGSKIKAVIINRKFFSVEDYAFANCKQLTMLSMPNGALTISGKGAFMGCENLVADTLRIQASSDIEASAFKDCKGIKHIFIEEGDIGDNAFEGCTGLLSVGAKESIRAIGSSAFKGCSSLTSVDFDCEKIGDYAFSDCVSLKSFDFSKLSSIPNHAFSGCTGLTSLNLPEGIYISTEAFSGCMGGASLDLPERIRIEDGAFKGMCMSSVTMPKQWSTLHDYIGYHGHLIPKSSFADCKNLVSVNFKVELADIGEQAFSGCTALTTVNFPDSLSYVDKRAFSGCTALTSANFSALGEIRDFSFEGCTALSSVNLPEGLSNIGSGAFNGCTALTSITLPKSLTSIATDTYRQTASFSGCTNITSVTLYEPAHMNAFAKDNITDITVMEGATRIPNSAFSGIKKLTAVNLPNSLKEIGVSAFQGCTALTSIKLPNGLETIDMYAFSGCDSIKVLVVPGSVKKIGALGSLPADVVLLGVYADNSFVESSWSPGFRRGTIYTTDPQMIKYCDGRSPKVKCILAGMTLSVTPKICGFGINLKKSEWPKIEGVELPVQDYSDIKVTCDGIEATPSGSNLYSVTGLDPILRNNSGRYHQVCLEYKSFGVIKSVSESYETTPLQTSYSLKSGQTYLVFTNIKTNTDETFKPTAYMLVVGDAVFDIVNDTVRIDSLIPVEKHYAYALALVGDRWYDGKEGYAYTTSMNLKLAATVTGPTTITAVGTKTVLDAKVEKVNVETYAMREAYNHGVYYEIDPSFKPVTFEGDSVVLTGLEPDKRYRLNYKVTVSGGVVEKSVDYSTPSLTFTPLVPRSVSATCSIVAAETNMSDEETRAGFQWKKYDAPETLKPSEGYAAIYEGRLEGYLKQLQSTAYYNVRPFYKSAEGNYYYGEWVTFDPNDFSYFEPTVHTYPADALADGTVTLRGYMLPGSDEVTEQGFEYWRTGSASVKARRIAAALAPATGVETVIATGQRMSAVLKDLVPSATYCFRSYAKTANGTTYGEEQTFTAPDSATGIESVEADGEVRVTGIYDISGRPRQTKQRGLNIIRYSDGTTRTVVVR